MRNYYLDLLSKYGISSAHPGGLSITKKILEDLTITGDMQVADMGCGTGQTLLYLAKNIPCNLTGVDLDERMLRIASKRLDRENQKASLVKADITELPFPPGKFDILLSESVTIFSDIDTALKDFARVLKRGGILVVVEMTVLKQLTERERKEVISYYGLRMVPDRQTWEAKLTQAGFRVIRSQTGRTPPTLKMKSLKMFLDFYPHMRIMRKYSGALGYGIYVCSRV